MAVAVPFALMPSAAIPGVIDFNTPEGRKLYTQATKKLEEELYACRPEELYGFLAALQRKD